MVGNSNAVVAYKNRGLAVSKAVICFAAVKEEDEGEEEGHVDDHDDETEVKIEAAEVVEKLERPGHMSHASVVVSTFFAAEQRPEAKVEAPNVGAADVSAPHSRAVHWGYGSVGAVG